MENSTKYSMILDGEMTTTPQGRELRSIFVLSIILELWIVHKDYSDDVDIYIVQKGRRIHITYDTWSDMMSSQLDEVRSLYQKSTPTYTNIHITNYIISKLYTNKLSFFHKKEDKHFNLTKEEYERFIYCREFADKLRTDANIRMNRRN